MTATDLAGLASSAPPYKIRLSRINRKNQVKVGQVFC
jgi:hypothetical protein